MRTELLKYIIEIDKLHSISKASNALYISQAALSESITQFEKELNVVIFERNKKGVTTTEAGHKIVEQAKCILNEVDKLYQISTSLPAKNSYDETLTFGVNEKFAHTSVLNKAINLAIQKHPALSFNAINANAQICMQAVANRDLNFAIIGFNKEVEMQILNDLHRLSLQHSELPPDPIYVLCNKLSSLHDRKTLSLNDIKSSTLITYSTISNHTVASIEEKFTGHVIKLYNLDGILQMVKDNIGITLLPWTLLTQAKEKVDDSFAAIPLSNAMQFNCIIYPNKKALTPAQEFFISIYKQCFNAYYA